MSGDRTAVASLRQVGFCGLLGHRCNFAASNSFVHEMTTRVAFRLSGAACRFRRTAIRVNEEAKAMKLYWGPRSCAIEIAALLDETGATYEKVKVDTSVREQHGATFRAVNPKGKIPVLVRDDGAVLTEWPAIALWIARTHPDAHLWPRDPEAEARAAEMMVYTVGTLHGQAFRRVFFPQEFCKEDSHRPAVQADGKAMASEGFDILADRLGDRPYAAGEAFSIADAAIFYTTRWAKVTKVPLPATIEALAARVGERPAFAHAVATLV